MTMIYSSPNSAAIGLLKSQLEGAGIACEMRNEIASQVLMGAVFDPELWLLADEQYQEARELIQAWLAGPSESP
jgi:hypothetical protein